MRVKVFKRQYFEGNDAFATFVMTLHSPSPNCEIGENRKLRIFYYDDETLMNDAYSTQVRLNSFDNNLKSHSMLIGVNNTISITSYKAPGIQKTLGNDVFVLRL